MTGGIVTLNEQVRVSGRHSSEAPLQVREVTTEDGFDCLRTVWNSLVDQLDTPSPFHSWEWNRTWWKHFGGRHRLRLLIFEEQGRVVGLAQLYQRGHGVGRLGLAMLFPLGWEGYRRMGLTEQLDLLFPATHRAQLLEALSAWLERRHFSAMLLPGVASDEALPDWLAQHIAIIGKRMLLPYRELPGSWDELVKGLNKSMRDNVKYYPRLLLRSGYEFTFEVAQTPEEVAAALPVLMRLHTSRARSEVGRPHRDYFSYPDRRAFITAVAPLLAERSELRIGLLKICGETVAAQLWLERRATVFLYYSGFDPAWSKYSVAMVATAEALKWAIASGLTRVEFLRGADQFKRRWDTANRVQVHLLLARHAGFIRPAISCLPSGWRKRRLFRRLIGERPSTAVNRSE